MIARMRQELVSECALEPGSLIVVGFSGGPDSTCLLDLLWRLDYPLVVAHVDHGLRPESPDDARFAEQRAAAYGLPCEISSQPVRSVSEKEQLTIEEAARKLRYQFLFQVAHQHGARAVAVAHNADDQVETVLMNVLRGAGLSGLRGMLARRVLERWSESVPLVRPLLGVWREEILAYCQAKGLEVRLDPTNRDKSIMRNRIRHELIPHLEGYNPRLRTAIWRSARALAGDQALVQQAVEQGWETAYHDRGEGFVRLKAGPLGRQPVGVQRGVARQALVLLLPDSSEVGFEATERVVAFLANPPTSGESDLVGGLRLMEECGYLVLASPEARLPASAWPQLAGQHPRELPIPGRLELAEGWAMEAAELDDPAAARRTAEQNQDRYQAWIDADSLAGPLTLRARNPGDRIKPLGLGGHSTKVSDLMVDARVPRRARAAWPVVSAGEQIVWVPGCRLGDPFRLRAGTSHIIHMRLISGSSEAHAG